MKIASKIDVITNSSMEVFTLKTDKTLEEVKEWLAQNTSDYDEPEYMKKESGPLQRLIDFGYVTDPESQESLDWFWIHHVFCVPEHHWYDSETWEEHVEKIEGGPEIHEAWKKYLIKNANRINSEYHKKNGKFGAAWNPVDLDLVEKRKGYVDCDLYPRWLPDGFVREFLDQYKGIIPKTADIPDHLNANSYIGEIGFCEMDENSIPYEDYDKICEELDGTTWHLG